MKLALWLACVGLVVASQFAAGQVGSFAAPPVQPLAHVLKHNAEGILRVLPKGWTLDSDKSQLKIVRDEPVDWFSPNRVPHNLNHAEMKAKGFVQQSKYVIALEFVPPVAEAEVNRMQAENAKTRRNLEALNREIDALQEKHSPYMEGWRGHAPRSDKERNLVAEYDKLKASLHRIPDYTTADASIFLSQSVGTFTLFYSDDVEKECRKVRQAVDAVFVREADPTRADPGALMGKFADAIDARDEKAMLACFDVHSSLRRLDSNATWVLRTLAALRLRDAMQIRFGREATEKALTDSWLQAPDTKRLRAARWRVEGGESAYLQSDDKRTLDWFYQSHIGVGWDSWYRWGWRMGVGVPASGAAEQRGIAVSQRLTELAEKLSEEVKAGKYKTAEEVGATLRSMQRSRDYPQRR